MADFIPVMIVLLVVAAILREDAVLLIFYLVAGIYFVGSWWSRQSLKQIKYQRSFPNRAFLGESIPIHLELSNPGWLPTFWILIHDSLPLDLISPNFFQRVTQLGAHHKETFDYQIRARKRGYYRVGPLYLTSGDLFGLGKENQRLGPTEYLIVYPQIVPLTRIGLPTRFPFGTLKHKQPIFEDPSRVIGKREYQTGDSLRHVDWKSSASYGQLLIKKFEPSIALETCIFLDLDLKQYDPRHHFDATELAIVTAASIANWVVQKKQSVGLCTNGFDPLQDNRIPDEVPPRKGRGHLMHCLDLLARIQTSEGYPILDTIRHSSYHLSWGTTILVITGHMDQLLLDELLQVHRRGLEVVIVFVGSMPGYEEMRRMAEQYGFAVHQVVYLYDLDLWR